MASTFDAALQALNIGRTGTPTAPTVAPAGSTTTLGQSDFLKLMTAQLKNQDPFNPTDNTQMVAQLAQFSSVAGISQVNTTLSSIATKLGATSVADATSYVGRNVLTAGNTAYPRASGGIAGAVELGGDTSNVAVTITSPTGQVLKTLQLGAQAQGTATYDWDGTTDNGQPAGAGPFKVSVSADRAGQAVSATNLVWAPVQSVSIPNGGAPVLTVAGLGSVPAANVRQIG